jgi:long-chain acyl-CoA synthetase
VAGGMALQPSVAEKWLQMTGTPIIEGYGLTEASPVLAFNPLEAPKKNSIGRAFPNTEIKIVGATGVDLPPGEVGELWARGPQVMRGYWQKPDETQNVLKEGWLSTGDLGFVDSEGYYTLVDRKKDMILVSGFNVYPNEVEAVLASHESVLEVAVIGIPDSVSGEAVKAFVVRKSNHSVTDDDLRSYCKTFLTGYKTPKLFSFVESLPKSNVGKILRRELRSW